MEWGKKVLLPHLETQEVHVVLAILSTVVVLGYKLFPGNTFASIGEAETPQFDLLPSEATDKGTIRGRNHRIVEEVTLPKQSVG